MPGKAASVSCAAPSDGVFVVPPGQDAEHRGRIESEQASTQHRERRAQEDDHDGNSVQPQAIASQGGEEAWP